MAPDGLLVVSAVSALVSSALVETLVGVMPAKVEA